MKNRFTIQSLATVALMLCLAPLSRAQTNVEMANLFQDVADIKQESGKMRLELQRLSKENDDLKIHINALIQNHDFIRAEYTDMIAKTEAHIANLKVDMAKSDEAIVKEVSKTLEDFSAEILKSYDAIAKASAAAPPPSQPAAPSNPDVKHEFGNDFPESGIEYTIAPGDNLWGIAKKNNSKVKWIQDANRISDPSKLVVGRALFIPQK